MTVLKALRAALCGPNPQHVILYGPPGIGKTAAARVILEEAKKQPLSPFKENAKFVEIDATTARFDDRGIADPSDWVSPRSHLPGGGTSGDRRDSPAQSRERSPKPTAGSYLSMRSGNSIPFK